MIHILKKELLTSFSSLIAYIVMVVFLIVTGLFLWVFPQYNVLDYGYADLSTLFSLAPYIFMFLIPAITMRSFAEEKKDDTMQLLLTRPLTDLDIIIGKYLSSWLLSIFALLPTLVYYYTIINLSDGNVDHAAIIGSYIGLFFLSAVFTAIGVFTSSLTKEQIVAFVASIFLCYLFYDGFSSIANINAWSSYSFLITQLGIDYHYTSISKGLIDSRNVFYFISVIITMIFSTKLVLDSRNW